MIVQASIAMGESDALLGPHVFNMNQVNDVYKIASKHVKIHCSKPKPKGEAKSKAAPKRRAA